MSTFLWDKIAFGPIKSRRLGHSLGINVSPIKFKACTFDCIYCECGWSRNRFFDAKDFETAETILQAIEHKLKTCAEEQIPVDSITFSGNGEPTLHPQFEEIIDGLLPLRDKYYPNAVITVLSNSTKIYCPRILDALRKIDKPIMKLDAGDEVMFQLINKPRQNVTLQNLTDDLKGFEGKFIMQSMFLKGKSEGKKFDNSNEAHLQQWLGIVAQLRPQEVMLYSLDRETPEKELVKLSREQLEVIADRVRALGIAASVY